MRGVLHHSTQQFVHRPHARESDQLARRSNPESAIDREVFREHSDESRVRLADVTGQRGYTEAVARSEKVSLDEVRLNARFVVGRIESVPTSSLSTRTRTPELLYRRRTGQSLQPYGPPILCP